MSYSYCATGVVVCVATEGGENVAKKQTSGNLALEQQLVIVIPAHDEIVARKLRVAAYARVSSSSEDQLNSYRVQNQYYSELISGNPDWEMVDIYADEGITGTSVERREDFQRMMQDCRKGKIDRILVKSISRFARNTKDCLAAVRELKELGVSVLFEEQGIDTARMSSEMVTAIMASLAQKQSESISGNTRMGIQWRMESGHFHISNPPLGFNLKKGALAATENGIAVVKFIFDAYLSGQNSREISEKLNSQQALNRMWTSKTVDYVLQNERYAGNALLQKRYTTDSFPRVKKRNRGERMQYYIADSNEAMITQEQFDRAQALRKNRKVEQSENIRAYSKRCFCSCGSRCRSKHINQIWYWVCVVHEEQKGACPIKQVPEETINAAFCRLYYKLKHHGNPIFSQMLSNLQKIRYNRMLWSEDVISINKKISDVLSQVQFLAQLQQAGGVDPDTFISSNNKLSGQLRRLKQEKARLLDTGSDDMVDRTRDLMDVLEDGPDFLDGFDAELFDALVEKIIVDSNERLRFRLKNGLELTEQIERTRR